MMVPPLSESMAMVSPNNTRGTIRPQYNPDSTSLSFFFWRGSASEDQTYRWAPVTHHHYISAQYHHIPEVTISRGNERRRGRRGRRDATLCDMFTTQGTWRPAPSQVLGFTTHLQGGRLQWQQPESVQCGMINSMCAVTFQIWFKNSCRRNLLEVS